MILIYVLPPIFTLHSFCGYVGYPEFSIFLSVYKLTLLTIHLWVSALDLLHKLLTPSEALHVGNQRGGGGGDTKGMVTLKKKKRSQFRWTIIANGWAAIVADDGMACSNTEHHRQVAKIWLLTQFLKNKRNEETCLYTLPQQLWDSPIISIQKYC